VFRLFEPQAMTVGAPITPSLDEPVSGDSSWLEIGVMGWRPGPGIESPKTGRCNPKPMNRHKGTLALQDGEEVRAKYIKVLLYHILMLWGDVFCLIC
jgi:hypothetical protein